MIYFIYISSIALAVFYFLLISYFFLGWLKLVFQSKKYNHLSANNQFSYSIVIAVRNEEKNILQCLQSIIEQNYPKENFEIVVVDDGSTDNTSEVVKAFCVKNYTFNIQQIFSALNQKKSSITLAISKAKNEFIVLTDADCTRKNKWLGAINNFINQTNCKMIYAPVRFKAKNIFEKMQALEFAGLVGIGASSIELKNPNMCSAANLIFEKLAFDEVDGYTDNLHIASGDDEFLLHKIFKLYPNQVKFLLNYDAMVSTSANTTMHELAEQRKRWVSKATKYENRYITLILTMAYLFNCSILVNFFVGFYDIRFLSLLAFQLGLKFIAEFIFLSQVTKHLKQFHLMVLLPITELMHIFYVIYIGIAGTFGNYTWKGRNIKNT